MIVTTTYSQGDHAFDPFYHAQSATLTKFGFALQRGQLIVVGSGGVQFARPLYVPALATRWSFEMGEQQSSSSSGCPDQSSSSSGQSLPGAIWEVEGSEPPWKEEDGVFQFFLPCGPATIKFEFE